MKKFLKSIVYTSIFISFAAGCSDIIEKSLDKNQVIIQAPADNVVLSNYNVTFLWENIDHALQYHLQIVQPTFNSINTILTDTLVSSNKFETILSEGEYQWRIRAENGSSETQYIVHSFSIDTNKDISNVTMIVTTPTDNFITNNNIVLFQWLEVPYTETYLYTITDTNNNVLRTLSTTQNKITDTLSEGVYYWKIVGKSSSVSTKPSVPRKIEIDQTPPNTPTLSSPSNNSIIQNPVTFNWSSTMIPRDSIIIATDSLFNNISYRAEVRDSTTITVPLTPNTYFWRVRSFDIANNLSQYSLSSKFTVTQ